MNETCWTDRLDLESAIPSNGWLVTRFSGLAPDYACRE
jgi:hypothetical protein